MAPNSLPVPAWLRHRWKLWAKRNNLDSLWTFELIMRPALKKNVAAQTQWTPGYHNASIEFNKDNYDQLDTDEADLLINHEQYHLLAARLDDTMGKMVGNESVVYEAYLAELERLADAFAHLMVRAYKRKRS